MREVRDHNVRPAVIIIVAEIRAHAGNRGTIVGQRHTGGEGDLIKRPVTAIVEKKIRLSVVGHKDVCEVIVIVVRKRHAHATPHKFADAGLLRDILKGPVAAVMVERVGQPLEITRMDVGAQMAAGVSAVAVVIKRELCVVDHKEVEKTLIVVIEPARGHRPFIALDSGLCRHVLEHSVAEVVVKGVAENSRYEQVDVAVMS